GEVKRGLADLLPEGEDASTFYTTKPAEAERAHGEYLLVPERTVSELVGEYQRSNALIRNFVHKPTKVWRALVLGLRPGFLVNNVVGNHLLFAIHAAGPEGLRAYLNAVRREQGDGIVRQLIGERYVTPALRQQFMDELFPEQ